MKRLIMTLVLVVGCSAESVESDLLPLEIPVGCNPLASSRDCLLPFPSDFYLLDDASMPTGRRVLVANNALPQTDDGQGVDLTRDFQVDGFSVSPTLMAVFGEAVDGSALVAFTGDIEQSLAADSATLVLDAKTGRRVLHIAELDPRAESTEKMALIIRPLERLANRTRYVVAVRHLITTSGDAVAAPEGFRRIRDGETGGDPVLAPIAQRFEEQVFPVLMDAGVERGDLQLAWDFTTGSIERVTGDMLSVRAQTIAALAKTPPTVIVTEVIDDVDESIGRKIDGTLTAPMYIDVPTAGASLNRDADGAVVQNGVATVPFTIIVPHSLLKGDKPIPARIIQFGHGFFGNRDEIEDEFVRTFANEIGVVVIGIEWWGMDKFDQGKVAEALVQDPAGLMHFAERVHQGMANQIATSAAVRGALQDLDELKVNGKLVYDPQQIYFYGISQGHILGGTLAALSPDFERIALSVGGAGLSHMMMRSYSFIRFLELMKYHLNDLFEQAKLVAMTQLLADRFDPVSYAPFVFQTPLDGSPADRQLLLQIGIGDSQVPNLCSHLHGRALGVPLLSPAPRKIAGMETVDAPHSGSALVEFEFGIEAPLPGSLATPPLEINKAHEGVRHSELGIKQVDTFFHSGSAIENYCDGACDPN